jgi:hypothetical protein
VTPQRVEEEIVRHAGHGARGRPVRRP